MTRRLAGRPIRVLLAMLACATAVAAPDAPTAGAITILYISREQAEPSRASLLEPAEAHYGLQGAEFGLQEINSGGRFLGKQYALIRIIVPANGDLQAEARKALADNTHRLVVADLQAKDLLTLGDLPEAKDTVILDARTSDDTLRQADCRANVFHLLPNWAMRADAIGQFLARRNWKRWFLLSGVAPADQAFGAAAKRAAGRFEAQVVTEKTFRTDSDDPSASREQIQAQLANATRTSNDYDVLFVADTSNAFGDYLLYNTAAPRLVVGTHGMVAEAWDAQFREYAARGVLYRFYKSASREMTERDYGNSLAMAALGDAVTRGGKTDPSGIKAWFLSDQFSLAANKGEGLTFRHWDQQLRQPLLLFGPRMLVAMAPRGDPQQTKLLTDTLGFDRAHSECRRIH